MLAMEPRAPRTIKNVEVICIASLRKISRDGYTHASIPHSRDDRRPSFYRTPSTKEEGYGCEPGNSTRTVGCTDKIYRIKSEKSILSKNIKEKDRLGNFSAPVLIFLRPLLFYNRQKTLCTLYSNDGFTITILLSTKRDQAGFSGKSRDT